MKSDTLSSAPAEGNIVPHEDLNEIPTADDAASSPDPIDATMELDEETALKGLTENVRDQDELERDITFQASLAMIDAEDKKDQKRIEKAQQTESKLKSLLKAQQQKLRAARANPTSRLRLQQEMSRIESEIELCQKDISDLGLRIEKRHQDAHDEKLPLAGGGRLPNETQREFLIRTGKITPFAKIGGPRPDGIEGNLADAIVDAEEEAAAEEIEEKDADGPRSHQNLRLPGFAEEPEHPSPVVESEFSLRPRKKRRVQPAADSSDEFTLEESTEAASPASIASEVSDDVDLTDLTPKRRRKAPVRESDGKVDLSGIDDGNEDVYQNRLQDWVDRRSRARKHRQEMMGLSISDTADNEEEWFKPSPDNPDHRFENGLKLPGDIYPSLFDYQKTGVQWLAELYAQEVGGIVSDEMGLGKTGMLHSAKMPTSRPTKLTPLQYS